MDKRAVSALDLTDLTGLKRNETGSIRDGRKAFEVACATVNLDNGRRLLTQDNSTGSRTTNIQIFVLGQTKHESPSYFNVTFS